MSLDEKFENIDPQRLYIIVDGSMPINTSAPQAVHAFTELAIKYPDKVSEWRMNGNIIIILESRDGKHLERLLFEGSKFGFTVEAFYEPDWGGKYPSAISILPNPEVRSWLSELSLSKPRKFFGERARWRKFKRVFRKSSGGVKHNDY